ncbi:MAG: DNA polymerase III subunit alpha [Clostridiales bacterium]|nr:DNA polymerase III subunit alpha [Clostridiales bacterium]
MSNFVHLHLHTEFSLLDGAIRIEKLMEKVKNAGMKAVAITDHGVMYGVIDFYNEAIKNNIKPIIGCEVYTAKRTRFDKETRLDADSGHLVLLAKNNIGYHNLVKVVSYAFTEGFYYKPRVDYDLLEKYSEGIICLSACLSGDIPTHLMNNDYEGAKKIAIKLNNIYGKDHFYLEMQNNGVKEQNLINQQLIKLSKETNIPLVITNDAHYLDKKDATVHDVLLCIQTGKKVNDEDRMSFPSSEFYVKTEEEMSKAFPNAKEAMENTGKISDMCNVTFEFDQLQLPEFIIKGVNDHKAYLLKLVNEGLKDKYKDKITDTHKNRAKEELKTISNLGYTDYFLIVHDFIRYAKENDIMVGPGRGSAAGSIVSYSLGITNIDPIKYDLLFERFLNKERVSMPDIDIDFCYENRQRVIDYVINKYGDDKVCQIITFGTMGARGAIRDVGRALDLSYAETDQIAKMIPFTLGINIEEALDINRELQNMYDNDERISNLIDTSRLLEGISRHSSTHAAGVVITKKSVNEYVPVQLNDENIVTQFPMETLEKLGILKMDFLGLRTLTVMRDCVRLVKDIFNKDIDLYNMEFDDKNVYSLISRGETTGVFQLESAGMTSFMKDLSPTNLEDIIAGISLYRPGPMDQIPRYLKNKITTDNIEYHHESLKPILDVTYGCMVYQEQVIRIVRDLAGYTMAHADIVRRAMSKKKTKVMDAERKIFIKGALEKGISEKISNIIFDEMMDFASYAFNKSHAAAYAVIAYQTAFLKHYYPVLFMASSLNSFVNHKEKVSIYIRECEKMAIKVLPPDVNTSSSRFSVEGSNIRFGLSAIKNVGSKAAKAIYSERILNGDYIDFIDFCERASKLDVNKKCVESMIKSGCFINFKENKRQLVASFEKILDSINSQEKRNIKGQVSLFETGNKNYTTYTFPKMDEFDVNMLLNMEKDMLGLYVTGNPLQEYKDIIEKKVTFNSNEKMTEEEFDHNRYYDGKSVIVAGIISSISKKLTRNNAMMAFIEIDDLYGSLEVIIFPKTLENNVLLIKEENKVIIEGKLSLREEEEIKIICQNISPLDKHSVSLSDFKNKKIYINGDKIDENKLYNFLQYFNGQTLVYIRKTISGKKITQSVPSRMNFHLNEETAKLIINEFGNENVIIKNY